MADLGVLAAELSWLKDNPQFQQRPATIVEFLEEEYLNIADRVRPGLRKALIKIFGDEINPNLISRKRRAMFTGAIGIGKGHTLTTPILTPKGWVPLADIKVGSSVIGSNGMETRVTGVYPRGELPTYRVKFNDGASVLVDGDHLWNVQSPSQKMRSGKWSTLSTSELIASGLKTSRGQRKWHIPVVEPVWFDAPLEALRIHPYTLGALLGDDNVTNSTPIITSADVEILQRVARETQQELVHISRYDYRIIARRDAGGNIDDRLNPLTEALRHYGIHGKRSYEKRIPREYLQADLRSREDLLRGLMDTDGYILRHGSTQISTSSAGLALDIQELVRSLGGIARLTVKKTAGRDAYILTLNVRENPFYLSRKADQWQPFEKYAPARMIESIELVGVEEIVCISVAAADQLYVTQDYIVTHNTTFASISIPYMVHWVSCLHNPQKYFELMDGSRIAFMLMSTTETQAKQVLFGDIKARVNNSKWFKAHCPLDDNFKNQLRFPKDIWVLPGNSQETTFEGYNILGGILDEGDSHKQLKDKDFAEAGWDTIHSRIDSRFNDPKAQDHRGLLIAIGQMKKASGFMAKKKAELEKDPQALVVSMAIWESLGWSKFCDDEGNRDSFYYDTYRKQIVPKAVVNEIGLKNSNLIEVPTSYRKNFESNPEKALRDLAGIPPAADSPFISMVDRIDECVERWEESHRQPGLIDDVVPVPVGPDPAHPQVAAWVVPVHPLPRVVHIDIAISAEGDALGLAMGHVSRLVEEDDELKPYIVFDFLLRMKAVPGTEIMLSDVRKIIYDLKEERNFKIKKVTMDGFQCLTGETLVPLMDGRTLSMRDLAERYPEGGVHTYTYDGEKITAGRVEKAWRTATKEVLEVHLDNGEVIRCTPDHRFMLRNGEYVQAQYLENGQSLMPLYRRTGDGEAGFMDGYEQIAQPTSETATRWRYTHRTVGGPSPEGYLVHHKDHNKRNNDPTNLEVVEWGEHTAHHHTREHWTDERRECVSSAISKSNTERVGLEARRRRHDVTVEDLVQYAHLSRRAVQAATGWSQDMIYARVREVGFKSWAEFKAMHAAANNHKVAKVVRTGAVEDVYDLQIADHHNFALDAGVLVHNSVDTRQQLTKRRIATEYLSVDKNLAPYYDLKEAIYERRVEFPRYITYLKRGDTDQVEIARKELRELSEVGSKVDHPASGSKDVADCMAGVVHTLMSDRRYRRVARTASRSYSETSESEPEAPIDSYPTDPLGQLLAGLGTSAPIPPGLSPTLGGIDRLGGMERHQ